MASAWRRRFFENYEVSDVCRSPLGRTISVADSVWFTLPTINTNLLRFSRDYAAFCVNHERAILASRRGMAARSSPSTPRSMAEDDPFPEPESAIASGNE